MSLPIDEIVQNGLVFNLFRKRPLDDITDIRMLRQEAVVDEERLLAILSKHLASHDIDELRRILQEQRDRRRFT